MRKGWTCVAAAMLSLALTNCSGPLRDASGQAHVPQALMCERFRDDVPFGSGAGSISTVLTSIAANGYCTPQARCTRWIRPGTVAIPAPNQSPLWLGDAGHVFTIAEQDAVIATARADALAAIPAGTHLYKLTFSDSILGPQQSQQPLYGVITATAYYGKCRVVLPVGPPAVHTDSPQPS